MSKGDMKKVREKFSIGDKVKVAAYRYFGQETGDEGETYRVIYKQRRYIPFDGTVIGGQVRYEGHVKEIGVDDITSNEVYRYLETTKRHVLVLVKETFFGKIYECLPEDVTIIKGGENVC